MLDKFDIEAMTESAAIREHRKLSIKPSGRDDNKIRSKNYHLRNNVTEKITVKKTRHRKSSRQINLQHISIIERLNDPALYKNFA